MTKGVLRNLHRRVIGVPVIILGLDHFVATLQQIQTFKPFCLTLLHPLSKCFGFFALGEFLLLGSLLLGLSSKELGILLLGQTIRNIGALVLQKTVGSNHDHPRILQKLLTAVPWFILYSVVGASFLPKLNIIERRGAMVETVIFHMKEQIGYFISSLTYDCVKCSLTRCFKVESRSRHHESDE